MAPLEGTLWGELSIDMYVKRIYFVTTQTFTRINQSDRLYLLGNFVQYRFIKVGRFWPAPVY